MKYVLGTIIVLGLIGLIGYGLKCLKDLHKDWDKEKHEKAKK